MPAFFFFFFSERGEEEEEEPVKWAQPLLLEASGKAVAEFGEVECGGAPLALLGRVMPLSLQQTQRRGASAFPERLSL